MQVNSVCVVGTLLLTGLICCSSSLAKVDPATCMAAWIFDEEDVELIQDITNQGNDGQVMGKLEWGPGAFGNALLLDGETASVNFGDNDQLDVGTENFTLVAWVKTPDYIPDSWRDNFVDKHESNPRRSYVLGLRGTEDAANQGTAWFILGLNQPSGFQVHSTTLINDEQWHHLAVTVDRSGQLRMYVDGLMEVDETISHLSKENEDSAKELSIGGSGSGLVEGSIDEVALFRTVLEEADVLTVMENGLEYVLGLSAVSAQGKLAVSWASMKSAR